ncbi:aromatic acid/H+ symport family MFS transporter [Dietzia aerolata]|uniref:MFS transporter n=1 Tax=Dietzia aerolata TaxID=595984 RepID=A0ABV5JTL4_9ACTN|nr:aromatic acid/H+ symport family MFS transporter [Dietzia aerolata]MBB0967822.1 aromatic acid/H+ symport family MFS transporter [Dietzia aerolata]
MSSQSPPVQGARRYLVVAVCFAAIVFDGYDLIVYGSTIPSLLEYEPWALTRAEAGAIGSYALLGMFFGAILAGTLTDRFGRRKLFIGCLVWYSTAMLAVALAPTPELLGLFRFIAGLGFGGVAPVAIALVVEVARPHEKNLLNALMLSGLPVGGVLAAVLTLLWGDVLGFRGLWALGASALILVVPFAIKVIPETAPSAPGPAIAGDKPARGPVRELVGATRLRWALILFAIANFAGFLLVFGLNTWLPELMRGAGYSLGSALTFQVLLNVGAIIGGLAGAVLADRYGNRLVSGAYFLVAALAITGMAMTPSLGIMYLVVLLAGAGSIGTQIVLFGYVATYYPARVRASALGISTGVGRLGAVTGPLAGGLLLTAGVSFAGISGAFVAVALLGLVTCLLVPRRALDPNEKIGLVTAGVGDG